MKLVPVLVVTNALALALVVVLWVQQDDLEARLGSARSGTRRADVPADTTALQDRIARLEARLAARGAPAEAEDSMPPLSAADDSEAPPPALANPGEGAKAPDFDPAEMEVFRQKVKKAQELNAEEEQLNRVIGRIDELAAENKIGALTRKQKEAVAGTILKTRRSIPDLWRKIRENNDMRNMSREERGAVMRTEFDSLRVEAQKSLEDILPAADAKTIIDDAMGGGDRGMWGGMRGPRRGGR
jgi:hypothetical protein